MSADYGQLQLRVAAKISGDPVMLAAYARGDDLHALTAQKFTGKAVVSKEERQLAKAVNFGILFGLGAGGLVAYARKEFGVEMALGKARQYLNAFFAAYPGLRRWRDAAAARQQRAWRGRAAPGEMESRTLENRRRLFDRQTPVTQWFNTPIQGTEADIAKWAMALLWERRAECPGAFPVLFVHDEIVLEVPEGEEGRAAAWLKRAMLDAGAPVLDPVPCVVEVKVGKTWRDMIPVS